MVVRTRKITITIGVADLVEKLVCGTFTQHNTTQHNLTTMAKKGKLLVALDAHKGRDYKLEKQKKLQKQAARKKKSDPRILDPDDGPIGGAPINGTVLAAEADSEAWESDESEDITVEAVRLRAIYEFPAPFY